MATNPVMQSVTDTCTICHEGVTLPNPQNSQGDHARETEEEENGSGQVLICCGEQKSGSPSTNVYCNACLQRLTTKYQIGEPFGNCPTCKKAFLLQNGIAIKPKGQCVMCGHGNRELGLVNRDGQSGYCDKCFICKMYPETYNFRYECKRCHQFQVIPHPMWRYQKKANEFTNNTWACHQRCGDYTHWKISSEDSSRIPVHERPASWNEN